MTNDKMKGIIFMLVRYWSHLVHCIQCLQTSRLVDQQTSKTKTAGQRRLFGLKAAEVSPKWSSRASRDEAIIQYMGQLFQVAYCVKKWS